MLHAGLGAGLLKLLLFLLLLEIGEQNDCNNNKNGRDKLREAQCLF